MLNHVMVNRRFRFVALAAFGLFLGVAGLQMNAGSASAHNPTTQAPSDACVISTGFTQVCSPALGWGFNPYSSYYPYSYSYAYSYPYSFTYPYNYYGWSVANPYSYSYPYSYSRGYSYPFGYYVP